MTDKIAIIKDSNDIIFYSHDVTDENEARVLLRMQEWNESRPDEDDLEITVVTREDFNILLSTQIENDKLERKSKEINISKREFIDLLKEDRQLRTILLTIGELTKSSNNVVIDSYLRNLKKIFKVNK